MDEIQTGVYQHHQGQRIVVLGEVPNDETGERMVLYRPEGKYDACLVRSKPKTEFLETILLGGAQIPQFKFISPVNEPTQSAQCSQPYEPDGCSFNSRQ